MRIPNTARPPPHAIVAAACRKGLKIDPRIAYNANSSDVSAQVLQLKSADPDVAIFVSYTSDAILFTEDDAHA